MKEEEADKDNKGHVFVDDNVKDEREEIERLGVRLSPCNRLRIKRSLGLEMGEGRVVEGNKDDAVVKMKKIYN